MEKSFVDYYLLEEYDQLAEYTRVDTFNKLNPLEKCLLIESLMKSDKKTAKKLADRLKIQADAFKQNEDTLNKIFDTVLNLNMLHKTEQIDLSNLKNEADSEFQDFSDFRGILNNHKFIDISQSQPSFNFNQALAANNSLFGGGLGGGFGAPSGLGGSLFNNIQQFPQTTFGGQIQQRAGGSGGLFGASAPQSQFNNAYAFGSQNLFNVQNRLLLPSFCRRRL